MYSIKKSNQIDTAKCPLKYSARKWEVSVNTHIVKRQDLLFSSLKLLHTYTARECKNTSWKPKADCQVFLSLFW